MILKSFIKNLMMRQLEMKPNISYSQEGEDLILDRLLDRQKNGFYVDVGAHHPVRFSNTYLFYKRGWRGINIDALPGSMEKFMKIRSRDINIECGVANTSGKLTYYRFNEPALNTFSENEANLKNQSPYSIIESIKISVEPLSHLLDQYLKPGQEIDFLSIDVEGLDEDVLRSNNWEKYRPRIILIETLRTDLLKFEECNIAQFLKTIGYSPVSKAYNTSFFVKN